MEKSDDHEQQVSHKRGMSRLFVENGEAVAAIG
jgi:hypothetical protein